MIKEKTKKADRNFFFLSAFLVFLKIKQQTKTPNNR